MKQRNIGLCILFSIITCGIYGYYWFYCLVDDCNTASNDQGTMSAGVSLLLNIVTCGIYGWYWCYKAGEQLNNAKTARGMVADNSAGIIYLVLAILGLQIISWCLIQNEINKLNANA